MQCPRCGSRKSWILKGGRRRCARCRFDWTPGRLPLRLTPRQWRAVLQWFLRGLSSAQIAHETHLDRKRVLRALTVLRRQMGRSMPIDVSSADQTSDHDESLPASRRATQGRPRSAVLGLRIFHGLAWAQMISDGDSARIARVLRDRKSDRSEITWPGAERYMGVVYAGRLYRLAQSGSGGTARFGQIESFWSFLQRRLKAKGGIRRHHLDLYLAEYAWRYNHRGLSPAEQLRETLKLVRRAQVEGMRLTPRARERRARALSDH
jgi:transposase